MFQKILVSFIYFFIIALIHSHFALANQNEIRVALSDVEPFGFMSNGQLTGYHIDYFKKLERESGLKFTYTLYPHARLNNLLEQENPDLAILFKQGCSKFADKYESGKQIYTIVPTFYLKESINPKKSNLRVGRIIGTCTGTVLNSIKKELIFDVVSMEQAIEMLASNRLDGVCGLPPVIHYYFNKNAKQTFKLRPYMTEHSEGRNSAVLCVKKSLSHEVKKKLENAMSKVKVPSFTN